MKDRSCRERWAEHKNSRMADLRKLWKAYCAGNEDGVPDLGTLDEYGLSFEYVPGEGRKSGYFRWQLSWGGPSDELRFYASPDFALDRVEYWFLDWYDGHGRKLTDADDSLLLEIWGDFFREIGAARAAFEKAEPGE